MQHSFTNKEIYEMTEQIRLNPIGSEVYIPVIFNFYIQQNIKKLQMLRNNIDECWNSIILHYGSVDEKGALRIPQKNIDIVNAELLALEQLTQEVELFAIPLNAFETIHLTTGQLKSLMPMIISDPMWEKRLLVSDVTNFETEVPTLITYE